MRVTQSMLSNNMLRNLNTSYSRMSQLQDQLSSGSKITRPSDDPVVAIKGMNYRVELEKIGQFTRNVGEAQNWLDTTDTTLGEVGDALNRVKELIIQAANDTNTADDRNKIQAEIKQIREQIADLANTQAGGKYIFSGTNTQSPLFVEVEHMDQDKLQQHFDGLQKSVTAATANRASLEDPALVADPVAAVAAQLAIDEADAIILAAQDQLTDFKNGIAVDNTPDPATGEITYDLTDYFNQYMTVEEQEQFMTATRIINARYTVESGDIENPIDRLTNINLLETQVTPAVPPATEPTVTVNTLTAILKATPDAIKVGAKTGALQAGEVKMEVFDGVQLQVNSNVTDVFARIDQLMSKVTAALEVGSDTNNATDISSLLGGVINLESATTKGTDFGDIHAALLAVRADVGAKQNRLEMMENRLAIQEVNVTKQMSENEDVDYAKAITDLTTHESIHQAALSVGAKIIQQTLVDFMR